LFDSQRDYLIVWNRYTRLLNAASAAYRDTVRLDPRNASAFNGLGWTLFDLGRLDESAAAHRAVIEIDPVNTDAHHALGVILVKQGVLDEAEASFRRAISRDR